MAQAAPATTVGRAAATAGETGRGRGARVRHPQARAASTVSSAGDAALDECLEIVVVA